MISGNIYSQNVLNTQNMTFIFHCSLRAAQTQVVLRLMYVNLYMYYTLSYNCILNVSLWDDAYAF